ncbi:MAG: hypothetical protein LAT63_06880 [Marinobacter sp.]|nr:hypothetical protein [Marinobacter sp.]
MSRQQLERYQVWCYLAAILLGLLLGLVAPSLGQGLDWLLWLLLGLLLYTTFTQVPLIHLQDAIRRPRFLLAAVLGNFVLLPALAARL